MRLRADQRLLASYLLLIALLVVPISIGADRQLSRYLMDGARVELSRELVLARALVEATPAMPAETTAAVLSRLSGYRVTLIDTLGVVVGESSPTPLSRIGNHLLRPEVQAALAGESGWDVRRSETVDEDLLYMAVLSPAVGVIRFARPLAEIHAALRALQRGIFGAGAVALLLAVVFSAGFSLALARPLNRLVAVARAMASGDLTRRLGERRSDEFGELAATLDSLADQLQRRLDQLEGERAEMQTLIDSMVEGVVALDPDGGVRRANPAARAMFDLPDEPRGRAPEAVSRRPEFLRTISRALAGERVPALELTSGDGRALLTTAQPLPAGGAVAVFLDVTELRRLEGVRRDFVANASHELKTPLTAIRGYSETLQDPELPPELRARFVDVIHANAQRLQRIVDDLLDLSRLESGGWQVHPEPVPVAAAVADAWNGLGGAAEEKRIELRLETDAAAERVLADPAALHQVLANLFSNALRYTAPGGSVTVRTRRQREGSQDAVAVEVVDTGTGIPAAHLPRIFERFYRADPARSREEGGTGLGLAIVKHLVEAHGGRVEAESRVGAGTTVRFTLPAAEERAGHSRTEET